MTNSSSGSGLWQEVLHHSATFLRQERQILLIISVYAIVVGLFSLIVPLTVQELVNTFAFSIQPIMIITLVSIMAGILAFVGIFKALQFFATDLLERRIFTRMTLTFARILPAIQESHFRPEYTSRFFEVVFMQRALSGLLVDLVNVTVSGVIGMTLLIFYHPLFLFFNILLIMSVILIGFLGKGGIRTTLHMSRAKYDTYHWLQEVTENLMHFKSSSSHDLILQKADALARTYVNARKSRFRVLLRQFAGSLSLQVLLHTGMLGLAGWLLSQDELTLGQLVGAEVVLGSILLNMETVVKRAYILFYFLVGLIEISHIFYLPKDHQISGEFVQPPEIEGRGIEVSISHLGGLPPPWPENYELTIDLKAGEKWAFVCGTGTQRDQFSKLLAGLEAPPTGSIRYNGVNVRDLHPDTLNDIRGLALTRHLTLFEATLLENITLRRKSLTTEDLLWVLDLVELQEDIELFPDGLRTTVEYGGTNFSPSQIIKILLARSLINRPKLLIVDGDLHELLPLERESILKKLCQPEQPWTLIIVSRNPDVKTFVQQSLLLT
jgi:putative ABC transport system ATP-binding protein